MTNTFKGKILETFVFFDNSDLECKIFTSLFAENNFVRVDALCVQ